MATVLALQSIEWSEAGWDDAVSLLRDAGHDVLDRRLVPSEVPVLPSLVSDVEALLVEITPVGAEVIEAAPRLQVIGKGGVGVDSIDVAAATRHGVLVCNTPGSNSASVAEHTMALLLALVRGLPALDAATRAGRGWQPWPPVVPQELQGRKLGVIGTGNAGRAVIQRALAFGLRIVAYDVAPDPDLGRLEQVRYTTLDDLLSTSDLVTVHVPLTGDTHRLLDARALARMRPGAFLVNVSRGGIVDEEALAAALAEGRLAGAAVDVFADEPALEHPLFGLDRCLVTPHAAGVSHAAIGAARRTSATNILAVLGGARPPSVVNPEADRVRPRGR